MKKRPEEKTTVRASDDITELTPKRQLKDNTSKNKK